MTQPNLDHMPRAIMPVQVTRRPLATVDVQTDQFDSRRSPDGRVGDAHRPNQGLHLTLRPDRRGTENRLLGHRILGQTEIARQPTRGPHRAQGRTPRAQQHGHRTRPHELLIPLHDSVVHAESLDVVLAVFVQHPVPIILFNNVVLLQLVIPLVGRRRLLLKKPEAGLPVLQDCDGLWTEQPDTSDDTDRIGCLLSGELTPAFFADRQRVELGERKTVERKPSGQVFHCFRIAAIVAGTTGAQKRRCPMEIMQHPPVE
jgi:hypothetical protein